MWELVCAAIQWAAGCDVRLCTDPLHAAIAYNPPRRIYKKGRVRGLELIRIDGSQSASVK